jgi:hypothetical protein
MIATNISDNISRISTQVPNDLKSSLLYLHLTSTSSYPSIKVSNISMTEVEQIIYSLRSKNLYRYDEISTEVLKISAPYISSPLCYICNKVISSGIFPPHLKHATVKPVYKKGYKDNFVNYRPVSIFTAFSKVLQKIIYGRFFDHILNNSILANEQFGFHLKASTVTTPYNLINEILQALKQNQSWWLFFF